MPVSTAPSLTTPEPELTVRGRSSRPVWLALTSVLALLTLGVLILAGALSPAVPLVGAVPEVLALTVLGLLCVLALLVAVAAHQRSGTPRSAQPADATPEQGAPAGHLAPGVLLAPGVHLAPGVLELHVRSLEEALVDQDARLDEVRRCAEDRLERLQHQDRERVRLTMVALRTELAGQPGVVALNRIETALSRLGAEPGTARPLLSASPTGSPPVSFATPRPALRPDPVEAPRGAAAVETPGTTSPPATQPEAMATTPDPVADTPPSPVVIRVLPVPAPVVDEVPRRGRRRNRRGALV